MKIRITIDLQYPTWNGEQPLQTLATELLAGLTGGYMNTRPEAVRLVSARILETVVVPVVPSTTE